MKSTVVTSKAYTPGMVDESFTNIIVARLSLYLRMIEAIMESSNENILLWKAFYMKSLMPRDRKLISCELAPVKLAHSFHWRCPGTCN